MLLFVEISLLKNLFEKHCIFSVSPHLHIWRTRIKLLTLQGINWIFGVQAKKQSDRNLITYPFTQNLQSSLPGTVVVEYASSKRQENNLVIVVVFYCGFLKKNCFEDI